MRDIIYVMLSFILVVSSCTTTNIQRDTRETRATVEYISGRLEEIVGTMEATECRVETIIRESEESNSRATDAYESIIRQLRAYKETVDLLLNDYERTRSSLEQLQKDYNSSNNNAGASDRS